MGLLVDGKWQDKWYDTDKTGGRFERTTTSFRNWVTADGEAGPSGEGGFKAEANRYHLYVSLACPWAHRALIFRKLKGLEKIIGISVVHWDMGENGWTFKEGDGVVPDPIQDSDFLHQIYTRAKDDFSGRVTVPVLYDIKRDTIVSNESAEIIRMFNSAFNSLCDNHDDYYPEALREDIDNLNDRVYDTVNNGVYKSGFATKQSAYEEAVVPLFETLGFLEDRLQEGGPYLFGDTLTEADWRLFTTLLRFEPVYFTHFKCNIKSLREYPRLWEYTLTLLNMPGVTETVNFEHIKNHYYYSHPTINPHRIIPLGPAIDWHK